MLGSVCCVSLSFSICWFCAAFPSSVSPPSASRLLPTSTHPNYPSYCFSPESNCRPSSVFKPTSPSLRCLTFGSAAAPCILVFVLDCCCFYYRPASLSPPSLGLFACFDCLLAGWSLPFMQSVNQVSTHRFNLGNIWNIPYVILHNTWLTAGNLSSSLFCSSQLHSFHSFPLSLSICVARSKHRSVFEHALSKQMSYFLRRADEGDGSPRICDASAQLKRLKQSQRQQKISDGHSSLFFLKLGFKSSE